MSDNPMADAAESQMGQILRGQMSSRYQDLLCHFIYEAQDIDGMTLWGDSGQPQWHAHMMKMRDEAKLALGPDREAIYDAFADKREEEIYGDRDEPLDKFDRDPE